MNSSDAEFGERLVVHAGRVRLLVAHLAGAALRRRLEVDDLIQEVFLRAVRDRERAPVASDGDAALGRWLAELARHAVIDAARAVRTAKRGARVERLTRGDWSTVGLAESRVLAATAGPATRVVAAEDQTRLERAFASLSSEHRRVIGLRQFEGLSAADTAVRMGRGEAAVHSLYRRGLQAWQAALEG
jgi:RNA polymerase sigma factor (sigma-70 family)